MTETHITILKEELSCNHLDREGKRFYEVDSDKFLAGDLYEINAIAKK